MSLHMIAGWRRAWRFTSVQAAALLTLMSVLMVLRDELLPLFQFAIPDKYWPWITGVWGAAIVTLRLVAQPNVLGPLPEEPEAPPAEPPAQPRQQGFVLQELLLAIAIAAGCLLVGYGAGRAHGARRCAQAADGAQAKAAQTAASATVATAAVAARAAANDAEIRAVFRDRVIKQYVEVPREVIVREDAACVIPVRFGGVWNSANRAELPTFAGQLDAAPSGVALSDVAAQHEREAELCLRNTEQLKALQAAELERQRVMEAVK